MRQWTVDAFADKPFLGNPACVLEPLDAWPDAGWMQALAQENNQAETAFLLRTPDPARFGLRWMTPRREVPLCGHATLAASHVLFAELGLPGASIVFETRSGPLTVGRDGAAYRMDFPASPPERIAPPAGLAEALGRAPLEVWRGAYLLALFETPEAIEALAPDLRALEHDVAGAGELIAAAPGADGFDVVSRFFAPAAGIPEDAATGSAHCVIAPLFADRLGRARLRCRQAFPGRGAVIEAEAAGARVRLGGAAVTAAESRLRMRPADV